MACTAAAGDTLDSLLGLDSPKEKKKPDTPTGAARFLQQGDEQGLKRVDSNWRPPPGFVARDELEHEAKLGGFHIDADVVNLDELLWICVATWHEQNDENLVRWCCDTSKAERAG